MSDERINRDLAAIERQPDEQLLTGPQEQFLALQLVHAGRDEPVVSQRARAELVRRNQGLVWKEVNRWRSGGMPMEDLFQIGMEGFLYSLTKWEPERGLKLSTYAAHWIHQRIRRAHDEQRRMVRLPVHLEERTRKLARATAELTATLARTPTDEEICREVGLTQKQLDITRNALLVNNQRSLDALVGDTNRVLGELIPCPINLADEVTNVVAQSETRQELGQLFASLSPREREIICRRHGIGSDAQTLEQIGRDLGITRERVRQIERKAFRALQYQAGVIE